MESSEDDQQKYVGRFRQQALWMGINILRVVEVVKMGTDDRADVFEVSIGGEHSIVKVVVALVHSFSDEVNTVSCIVL